MNEMKFPVSKNKCLTIEKIQKFNEDRYFLNNFYEKFKKVKKVSNQKLKMIYMMFASQIIR